MNPDRKKPLNPVLKKEQLGERLYLAHLRGGGRRYRTDYQYTNPETGKTTGRTHTYGPPELLSREEVRDLHTKFLAALKAPRAPDPSIAIRALRDERVGTFESKCRKWNDWRRDDKQISEAQHAQVLERMALHVFPIIGAYQLNDITTPMLFTMLEAVAKGTPIRIGDKVIERKASPSVPAVLRSWLRMIWTDAINRDPNVKVNPAADVSVKKHKGRSHARVGAQRLPQFFRDLREYAQRPRVKIQTVLALRLMVHWAVRCKTLVRMKWDYIDEARDMVRVPAANMKDCDRLVDPKFGDFLIPLTNETRAILAELKTHAGASPFMFPHRSTPGGTIAPQALLQAIKYMGWTGKGDPATAAYRPNATAHGFRSTFKTHASQNWKVTDRDADALHYQFDHSNDDGVDARYVHDEEGGQRSLNLPERFKLMAWWSAFVAEQEHDSGPVVVPIRRVGAP